jgi:hypothetical protein
MDKQNVIYRDIDTDIPLHIYIYTHTHTYIYAMEYCSSIKENEIMTFAGK